MSTQDDIIKDLIEKSKSELATNPDPIQNSRTWQHPEGYKYLVQWSNAVLLRYLMRILMADLPNNEFKQKIQANDVSRSVVRNLEEGYKRSDTATYLDFVGYSQGSLEEVKGDVRDLTEDGFLKSHHGSNLSTIGINLADFHTALKPKGTIKDTKGNIEEITGTNTPSPKPPLHSSSLTFSHSASLSSPLHSSNHPLSSFNPSPLGKSHAKLPSSDFIPLAVLYPPLKNIQASNLSYEIFIELINKTDYLFRVLVQSLEKKLHENKKGYQIQQLRIKKRIK